MHFLILNYMNIRNGASKSENQKIPPKLIEASFFRSPVLPLPIGRLLSLFLVKGRLLAELCTYILNYYFIKRMRMKHYQYYLKIGILHLKERAWFVLVNLRDNGLKNRK